MNEDIKSVFEQGNDKDKNINTEPAPKNDSLAAGTKIKIIAGVVIVIILGVLMFGVIVPKKKPNQKTTETTISSESQIVTQSQQFGSVNDDQVKLLQQDNQALLEKIDLSNKNQEQMYAQLNEKIEAVKSTGVGSGGGGGGSTGPVYRESKEVERFTGEYQSKVQHFKDNRSNFWALSDDKVEKLLSADHISGVPADYRNISNEPSIQSSGFNYLIPAGSRIIAISEQPVNSDHPGFFTSRIIRPYILKDAKLICQAGAQTNDRIPVNPVKIVLNGKEYTLAGQVEMNFPGLEGQVTNHWPERLLPAMVNGAIAGGFIAWSASQNNTTRINTQDAITASVVQQTIPGIQNEVSRMGGDKPNTVAVPQGQQFAILLTDKLEVKQ